MYPQAIEIVVLTIVGYTFRPQLMNTIFYIEMSTTDRADARCRIPPLYLVPVPPGDYDQPTALATVTTVSYNNSNGVRVVPEPPLSSPFGWRSATTLTRRHS